MTRRDATLRCVKRNAVHWPKPRRVGLSRISRARQQPNSTEGGPRAHSSVDVHAPAHAGSCIRFDAPHHRGLDWMPPEIRIRSPRADLGWWTNLLPRATCTRDVHSLWRWTPRTPRPSPAQRRGNGTDFRKLPPHVLCSYGRLTPIPADCPQVADSGFHEALTAQTPQWERGLLFPCCSAGHVSGGRP